eukprot:gene27299-4602_t
MADAIEAADYTLTLVGIIAAAAIVVVSLLLITFWVHYRRNTTSESTGVSLLPVRPPHKLGTDFKVEAESMRASQYATIDDVMKPYKKHLLQSAFDLQSRLYQQVATTMLNTFKERSERDELYAIQSTAYMFAEFMAWMEVIRKMSEYAESLNALLDAFYDTNSPGKLISKVPLMKSNFDDVAKLAQLSGTPKEIRYALSEEAAAAAQAQVSKMPQVNETKSKKEVGLSRANALMDMVAAGDKPSYDHPSQPTLTPTLNPHLNPVLQVGLARANALMDMVAAGDKPSYEAIRSDLAEAYLEAGFKDVSNFITTTT